MRHRPRHVIWWNPLDWLLLQSRWKHPNECRNCGEEIHGYTYHNLTAHYPIWHAPGDESATECHESTPIQP